MNNLFKTFINFLMTAFSIVVFCLGFVLILKGGDLLIEASIWFAEKTKIPPMIVGATIVSIATTFPETTIAIIASAKGLETVAINTAIGAMVCNFALVLGLAFLMLPKSIKQTNFVSKWAFFLGSILLLFVFGIDGRLGVIDATLLITVFVMFIVFNFREAKNSKEIVDSLQKTPNWIYISIQFVVSALAIGLGASALVDNVPIISQVLGIDESIVGFTIIAIGTNIPELVTTISASKMNNPEIGIGNIFGASIINCTLLMPCAVFFSKSKIVHISTNTLLLSCFALLIITCIISLPIIKKGATSRKQGFLLLLAYFLYSYLMVALGV